MNTIIHYINTYSSIQTCYRITHYRYACNIFATSRSASRDCSQNPSHFAKSRLYFSSRFIQVPNKAYSALNRLYQSLVNSHRCLATSSSSSPPLFDENFTRTIRQVHFACIPHGNYMTWTRRGAFNVPGRPASVRKRIVQFSPLDLHSREWTTSRERRIPPVGRKRVKGSLYLPGHLEFEFNVRP